MTQWLPFVILIVFGILLLLMPWHRPHPNHVLVFNLIKGLTAADKEHCDFTVLSSSCNTPLTISRYKDRQRRILTG